jgi:hypothetical protein
VRVSGWSGPNVAFRSDNVSYQTLRASPYLPSE